MNNQYDSETQEFEIGDLLICKDGSEHLLINFLENGENDYDDESPDQIFKVKNLNTNEIKDYIKVMLFEDDFEIVKVLKNNEDKVV